jgi:hypothetical protein
MKRDFVTKQLTGREREREREREKRKKEEEREREREYLVAFSKRVR